MTSKNALVMAGVVVPPQMEAEEYNLEGNTFFSILYKLKLLITFKLTVINRFPSSTLIHLSTGV